uniref:Zinc finger, CCHC-type n=1 Tax=Tanacetum cinerariifolium TaxID=118510 RepID=A0A6L2JSH0_TANCI|nr:zinc finger, CCHC-type [Tanacetum cinerariifolium]
MEDMFKDGLILGFNMDTEKCKTCMLTKVTKKPFQNVKCETKVLKLIYSDLYDLHATSSLGNKKYFVTFIDDASSGTYQYHMTADCYGINSQSDFSSDDMKTTFFNGKLGEEVYMNQPQGFIMLGKENKADKYVYSKFDESGKGVIICLYVDDMLIFGTDQIQVDLTKEFSSSSFSMKDVGEADVILVSTSMDKSEKPMTNNVEAVSQIE